MDQTTAHARAAATVRFEDGLGRRHQVVGVTPEPLEVLVLKEELATAAGFEDAVRAQVARVAGFRHPSFAQVRGVARPPNNESGLAVISQQIGGVRLSDLLAVAEKRLLPLDMATACWLTRELISAIAVLHEALPALCHGAIAPERVVITPDGRLVVVEHILGGALPKLRWSRVQYWRELRLALPAGDGFSSFGPRSDVAQVGAVALALMLGHPLGEDYPVRVGGSTEDASALSASAALDLLPDGIRSWMLRALQLGADEPFTSAGDAHREFMRALEGTEYARVSRTSDEFMAAYRRFVPTVAQGLEPSSVPASPAANRQVAAPAPVEPTRPPLTLVPTPEPAAAFAPEPADEPEPESIVESFRNRTDHLDPIDEPMTDAAPAKARLRMAPRKQLIAAAAGLLVVVASGTAFAVRSRFQTPEPTAPATGFLSVTTDPAGLTVNVDGKSRGASPLRLDLPAGSHVLEIVSGADRKNIPVAINAGAEVAQFVEMPKKATVSATGQLQIRTEPSGARVMVDGQQRGTSPLSVTGLTPGSHKVTVESDAGMVTEDVTIQAGATSSLILPLAAPRNKAPMSGWITVSAPAEVQLFENGQLLGTSSIDRIMAPVGKHDLEIVNEALGFRESRSVTVVAGQVSAIAATWPKGSMALNALPWAEVWVDGERIGETPVGNLPVAIGAHEIVFRHPDLGEQRYKTTVTLAGPARVTADLRKK